MMDALGATGGPGDGCGEADRLRAMSPKEAGTAVEGIFVTMLVSEMKKTLSDGGFFGNGPGSGGVDGMFDQMFGEEMARRGGLGLGSWVQDALHPKAGAHQAPPAKAELEGTRPA
jgi:Rod binding domain-containing protein